jgi:hypothetical protein
MQQKMLSVLDNETPISLFKLNAAPDMLESAL